MEVWDAIRARRSVRSYDSAPVPQEVLDRVLEAGRIAPSANNTQPWHFIVVTNPDRRAALSDGRYAKFLKESPVVIVGCGDKKASPDWYIVDTTIALQNMVMQATSEGLGTCWIGSFFPERVAKAVEIPDNLEIVAMIALGYPKKKMTMEETIGRKATRKERERIISFEVYGKQA